MTKDKIIYNLIFACPGYEENGFKIRAFRTLSDAKEAFMKDYNGCVSSDMRITGENLTELNNGHAYADFDNIALYLRKVEME